MWCFLFWAKFSSSLYSLPTTQFIFLFFYSLLILLSLHSGKNCSEKLQVLKHTDVSLVSHMLMKSKVNISVEMWGPNFTLFFFFFFPTHATPIVLVYLNLFCSVPPNVCVGDVVMPNRQNNPLLWEDHGLGFTSGCGDVLEMDSFNLQHLLQELEKQPLLLELENLGIGAVTRMFLPCS